MYRPSTVPYTSPVTGRSCWCGGRHRRLASVARGVFMGAGKHREHDEDRTKPPEVRHHAPQPAPASDRYGELTVGNWYADQGWHTATDRLATKCHAALVGRIFRQVCRFVAHDHPPLKRIHGSAKLFHVWQACGAVHEWQRADGA